MFYCLREDIAFFLFCKAIERIDSSDVICNQRFVYFEMHDSKLRIFYDSISIPCKDRIFEHILI